MTEAKTTNNKCSLAEIGEKIGMLDRRFEVAEMILAAQIEEIFDGHIEVVEEVLAPFIEEYGKHFPVIHFRNGAGGMSELPAMLVSVALADNKIDGKKDSVTVIFLTNAGKIIHTSKDNKNDLFFTRDIFQEESENLDFWKDHKKVRELCKAIAGWKGREEEEKKLKNIFDLLPTKLPKTLDLPSCS